MSEPNAGLRGLLKVAEDGTEPPPLGEDGKWPLEVMQEFESQHGHDIRLRCYKVDNCWVRLAATGVIFDALPALLGHIEELEKGVQEDSTWFSEIDHLLAHNELGVSTFDLHRNPKLVFEGVKKRFAQLEAIEKAARLYREDRKDEHVRGHVLGCAAVVEVDDRFDPERWIGDESLCDCHEAALRAALDARGTGK